MNEVKIPALIVVFLYGILELPLDFKDQSQYPAAVSNSLNSVFNHSDSLPFADNPIATFGRTSLKVVKV